MNLFRKIADWFRHLFNRYEGAQFNPSRSMVQSAYGDARFDASASTRKELARKARYFEQNNAIVNRLADLFECYTVGTGLVLTPSSSEPDWNQKAKEWWDGWCANCDLTSRASFGTIQSLAARTWFIDGECFIPLTRGESGRPRIQLLEGHLCATPDQLAAQEGKTICDGVVLQPNGRPAAYYFGKQDGNQIVFGAPANADFIVHVFEPSRAGMYRGLTFLYPVINDLHDLDDLQLLEMQAAKQHAEVSRVITTENGEWNAAAMRRAAVNTGSGGDSKGSSNDRTEHYQNIYGAKTMVLKRGDDMKLLASARPSVVTQQYWDSLTAKVCAGVGIPAVLVFPESMQGTVYRGALDSANAFFRARSAVLASAFERIYVYAMGWAVRNERALADPPADWARVSIRPPRAVNVDVGRNSSAMIAELEARTTNYELIYAPLGLDWREEFRKLKEQQDYAASIGLDLGQPAAPAPMPQAPPPKPEPAPPQNLAVTVEPPAPTHPD